MNSLNTRIISTHDTEDKWNQVPDFIPRKGEIIVYDIDSKYSYERFKIGDGKTKIADLQFTIDSVIQSIFNIKDNVITADAGRVTTYK